MTQQFEFGGLIGLRGQGDKPNEAVLAGAIDGVAVELSMDAGDLANIVLSGIAELSRLGYSNFTILFKTSQGIDRASQARDPEFAGEFDVVDEVEPITAE